MSEISLISSPHSVRKRARQNPEQGAVVQDAGDFDAEATVQMLNDALATELVCTLRYKQHYYMVSGINGANVADEFLEHANEELSHADTLATRIVQLGGKPDFAPDSLADRSHSKYVETDNLEEMVRENLIAERVAIQTYREMIRALGSSDPTTRRILEDILMVEEEHADDLAGFLNKPSAKKSSNSESTSKEKESEAK